MGADSVIFIRTDGNDEIATGHLVRCLSIARAVRKITAVTKPTLASTAGVDFTSSDNKQENSRIIFLVSDETSKSLLNSFFEYEAEFPIHILETARYNDLEAELPELVELAGNYSFVSDGSLNSTSKPILLVDSYFVTEKYFLSLKKYFLLAYLDDLRAFDYPVDLVINYDILTAKTQKEYEAFYSRAGEKLLGGAYAPLRPQFQSATVSILDVYSSRTAAFIKKDDLDMVNAKNNDGICHVLIASGGSDPYHTTFNLTKHLLKECPTGYCFELILGSMNPDKRRLEELAECPNQPIMTSSLTTTSVMSATNEGCSVASQITLHQNVSDMASLMRSCHLALSAAGTTLYELCAVGVPTASFIIADNQIASAQAFAENNAIPCLGDVRSNEEDVKKEAACWVTSMNPYIQDSNKKQYQYQKYQDISEHMRQLVDGNGAIRIAEALVTLYEIDRD